MRTTWLILFIMVLAGIAMYYFASRPKPVAPYDTITLHNTPDSIRQKLRLFAAYDASEIIFRDSVWFQHDSIPLKEIPLDSMQTRFNKQYSSVTFYLDYDHAWFYDVEVNKAAGQDLAYQISFSVNKVNDTLRVQGIINDPLHDQLQLTGPMMGMYRSFLLTYNGKQPAAADAAAVDSLITDSMREALPSSLPSRTITVLKP